jgi:hypothetical protein
LRLDDGDIQKILRERVILVHGNPIDYNYGWDLKSFGRLYDVDKKINVHGGNGIPYVNLFVLKFHPVSTKADPQNPEHRHHQGTLRELYNITKTFSDDECPPLNAISLPAYGGDLYPPPQFSSLASHEVAKSRVAPGYANMFDVSDLKHQMEWSLIGVRGTVSPLHADSEGLGTEVVVLDGSKYWILVTRFGEHEIICSVDSLGPNWDPYFINKGNNADRFRFEGVHLQKGDML